MKSGRLLLVLSMIFSIFWSHSSWSADVTYKMVSAKMYATVQAKNASATTMMEQLQVYKGVTDQDGNDLSGSSLNKLKKAIQKGLDYDQYIASLTQSSPSGASNSSSTPPPPPPSDDEQIATAPDSVDVQIGSNMVTVPIAGRTVSAIAAALQDVAPQARRFATIKIKPKEVKEAVMDILDPGRKKTPSGSPSGSPSRPRPSSAAKPSTFGFMWLRDASIKGLSEDKVYAAGSAGWNSGIAKLQFYCSPTANAGSVNTGKYKVVTAMNRTVGVTAQKIVESLKEAKYYPAPVDAFEAAWNNIYPDGGETKTFDGQEILDPQHIEPLKAELLRLNIVMPFKAATASSTNPSQGSAGSSAEVVLPDAWLTLAAQWFKDQGKSEVKRLYMGGCVAAVGVPSGFEVLPMNGGFQKNGVTISMEKVTQAVADKFAALDSGGASQDGSSQGASSSTFTVEEYDKIVADMPEFSGLMAGLEKTNYLKDKLKALSQAATSTIIAAMKKGLSGEQCRAEHPELFAGGVDSSGSSNPSSGASHTPPPPPPAIDLSGVSVTVDDYTTWKKMASMLPDGAVKAKIAQNATAGDFDKADVLFDILKASATYDAFKAAVEAKGGTAAAFVSPPPANWGDDYAGLAAAAGWNYKEDVKDPLPVKVDGKLTTGITAEQVKAVLSAKPSSPPPPPPTPQRVVTPKLVGLNQTLHLISEA